MSQSKNIQDFEEPEIHSDVDRMRHSCAHIMAHAISRIWPKAQFGIGPTIEHGFYYDISLDEKISPEDLPKIEAEMKKIIKENSPFVRSEHSVSEAIAFFKKANQPFKVEIIENLRDQLGVEKVSSYSEGDFVDLCKGPHVEKSGQIKAFRLTSVAGAYWRGDEKRPQLQRIYGVAFMDAKEMEEHLALLEEAKKRDHRKLGKELDLFSFHPEAPAMPFFHPKGTVIYNRLVEYVRKAYARYGYQEVVTPMIMDLSLWHRSGHWENYRESMYVTEIDERQFGVKPMNCPGHTFIYAAHKRSYRDLPLRIADFGRLHRYERSGVTAGLTRVRSFSQDDAHLFCTHEQIESEIRGVIEMIMEAYKLFQFTDVAIYLSTRPEKRVGSDQVWDNAESALKKTLDGLKLDYTVNKGDGAFYGPKIDFIVKDALKRPWQLGTIQLDFNMPERFDLTYVGADNTLHRPVMVHRAVLGSLERFMGLLIEHTAGAFPFWLSPVQARVIPITENHLEYCRNYADALRAKGYRVELDERNESMGFKTRDAQTAKIPYSLVAGDREIAQSQFSVRKYGEKQSSVLGHAEIEKTFAELNSI